MNRCFTLIVHAIVLMCLLTPLMAQWRQKPTTGSPQETFPDRTVLAGQSGLGAALDAWLENEISNARQHRALVHVHVIGAQLVGASAATQANTRMFEGHLRYQLNSNSPIRTTSQQMEFRDLPNGRHTIRVVLEDSKGQIFSPEVALVLQVP